MSFIPGLDWAAMRDVDVRTADPAALADIRDVKIDSAQSPQARMTEFIKQIGNPYCFRYGDMVIKISHADTKISMEERMEGFFRAL